MKTLTKDGNFQQLFAFSSFSRWANNDSAILSSNTQIRNHSLTEIYQAKKSQGNHFIYIHIFFLCLNKFVGAWKKTLPTLVGNYGRNYVDRPTNQPSDRRTDRVIGKYHLLGLLTN